MCVCVREYHIVYIYVDIYIYIHIYIYVYIYIYISYTYIHMRLYISYQNAPDKTCQIYLVAMLPGYNSFSSSPRQIAPL